MIGVSAAAASTRTCGGQTGAPRPGDRGSRGRWWGGGREGGGRGAEGEEMEIGGTDYVCRGDGQVRRGEQRQERGRNQECGQRV